MPPVQQDTKAAAPTGPQKPTVAAAAPAAPPAATAAASTFDQRDKFKLVVVGDEAVGKTSIITRFMYDSFEPTYNVTIGIDFASKNVYLEDRVVRLQLWDTAGQERFRSLIPLYTRDSAAAILVFDLTSRKSFANVAHWIEETRKERGDAVLIVLVGNKTDIADAAEPGGEARRMVSTGEALATAAKYKLEYYETSAKTGDEIRPLFQYIAEALVARPATGRADGAAEVATIDVSAAGNTAPAGADACSGLC
jgi:Ras-related protein Rab-6A